MDQAGKKMRRLATLEQQGEGYKRQKRHEARLLLTLILAILVLGTFGFAWIEGWAIFDALYMTVITLSTVGFQEVHPLSEAGRAFAILLIFTGVGVAMTVLPRLAGGIIERQLYWASGRGKMQEMIERLEQHTIFCGFSRLSQIAVRDMAESDANLLIIEHDEERAARAREEGFLVVQGDATQEETLMSAGVRKAKRLVSLLPKDADNLYVILTSRELNPALYILSRSEDEGGEKRMLRAGATRVISPYRASGEKISNSLLRPYVTDFLDLGSYTAEDRLLIEEIKIPNVSPMLGLSLKETEIRQKTNVIVVAIIPDGGQMVVNPVASTRLEAGATLIGLGFKKDLTALEGLLVGGAPHREGTAV